MRVLDLRLPEAGFRLWSDGAPPPPPPPSSLLLLETGDFLLLESSDNFELE